ncbi:thrombospondin type 3 repeat-containing protein [bacterium]|nr:thrombospondin type 3 repeat-containing protein [bacterium]
MLKFANSQSSTEGALDTDKDGLSDQEEIKIGTDPRLPNTDGDGYTDGEEVANGFDPLH